MFGVDTTLIGFIALVAVAVGGLAYALLFDRIVSEKKSDARLSAVKTSATDSMTKHVVRDRQAEAAKRRKSVETSLKDLEAKQKQREKNFKSPPIKMLLMQAGLRISIQQYYLISFACGLALTVLSLFMGAPVYLAPGAFLAGALGLPRWGVLFMRARRVKAFLKEFPNAIDVIVRAVKSGLPLNDGLRLIAHEAREPVRTEFRRIIEAQQMGLSIPEATGRMPEYMPCPEANFFAIVIQIQAQAGGNLSEALGNLSKVLRDRKKMKDKADAMSMEAKASAAIIGSLPFIVCLLVYLTSPDYIALLFTTDTGNFVLGVSGVWMSIGIFVMKKMINFKI
ncbi:MAG: type II secretion system F family protein [Phyllobacterium sp.]